jgi:hypothetical protein
LNQLPMHHPVPADRTKDQDTPHTHIRKHTWKKVISLKACGAKPQHYPYLLHAPLSPTIVTRAGKLASLPAVLALVVLKRSWLQDVSWRGGWGMRMYGLKAERWWEPVSRPASALCRPLTIISDTRTGHYVVLCLCEINFNNGDTADVTILRGRYGPSAYRYLNNLA